MVLDMLKDHSVFTTELHLTSKFTNGLLVFGHASNAQDNFSCRRAVYLAAYKNIKGHTYKWSTKSYK